MEDYLIYTLPTGEELEFKSCGSVHFYFSSPELLGKKALILFRGNTSKGALYNAEILGVS